VSVTLGRDGEHAIGCVGIVLALAIGFAGMWWSASCEAAAYERVTGIKVSTWDALFLELRVDGSGGKK
jgi:hypothetical protein